MADKKVVTNLTFCFIVFNEVFDKQVNIRSSTGSISRLTSPHDHNATDQAITMDRYQSYFKKLDIFFSGK